MPNQLSSSYFKTSPEIIQLAVMLQEEYALNELAKTIKGKLPQEVVRQVYNGKLDRCRILLDT